MAGVYALVPGPRLLQAKSTKVSYTRSRHAHWTRGLYGRSEGWSGSRFISAFATAVRCQQTCSRVDCGGFRQGLTYRQRRPDERPFTLPISSWAQVSGLLWRPTEAHFMAGQCRNKQSWRPKGPLTSLQRRLINVSHVARRREGMGGTLARWQRRGTGLEMHYRGNLQTPAASVEREDGDNKTLRMTRLLRGLQDDSGRSEAKVKTRAGVGHFRRLY